MVLYWRASYIFSHSFCMLLLLHLLLTLKRIKRIVVAFRENKLWTTNLNIIENTYMAHMRIILFPLLLVYISSAVNIYCFRIVSKRLSDSRSIMESKLCRDISLCQILLAYKHIQAHIPTQENFYMGEVI